MDDKSLFEQAMMGVRPLAQNNKISLSRDKIPAEVTKRRRVAAQAPVINELNPLSDHAEAFVDGAEILQYKHTSVQNAVFRKLKQAKFRCEAVLDLHGLTIEQAREEVFDFIQLSRQQGCACITIVHGKGHNSDSNKAALKTFVNRWLLDLETVLAYCSAQPKDGGTGSVYVLLKR